MKVAFISDIHSNLEALKAVLKSIHENKADRIYCLGDLVGYLNRPNEVVDTIRGEGIKAIIGNNDRDIVFEDFKGDEIKEWTYNTLTPENIRFLRNLPRDISLTIEGNRLKLVHGGLKSCREYLREGEENTLEALLSLEEDILIAAHTHIPYIDFYNNKMMVNCGSVGKPKFGSPYASYALLTLEEDHVVAEIVEVEYDVASTAASLREEGFPEELIEEIQRGKG